MLRLCLTFAIALTAFAALPAPATAAATATATATAPLSSARLRPQSPRVAAWLARGRLRSPTLRALADEVERGDVVVYLEIASRLDPSMAACVTWMASVPGARYVRVSVRQSLREADAIAMLAHELQHVVEVIASPEVQSGADLAALYQRIGHRTGGGPRTWDTVAALRVGDLARLEMARGGAASGA